MWLTVAICTRTMVALWQWRCAVEHKVIGFDSQPLQLCFGQGRMQKHLHAVLCVGVKVPLGCEIHPESSTTAYVVIHYTVWHVEPHIFYCHLH